MLWEISLQCKLVLITQMMLALEGMVQTYSHKQEAERSHTLKSHRAEMMRNGGQMSFSLSNGPCL